MRSAVWVDRVKWDEWKHAVEISKKHWTKGVNRWGEQAGIAPVNLHAKETELNHAALKVRL